MKASNKDVIEALKEQIRKSDYKPSAIWVLEEDVNKIEEGILKELNTRLDKQIDNQIKTFFSSEPTGKLKGIENLSNAYKNTK